MKSNTPSKDFIDQICSLYGEIYDDREEDSRPPAAGDSSRISGKDWAPGQKSNHKSLLAFQNQLKKEGISLSTSKIRKILITGGCWSTERSRQIMQMYDNYTTPVSEKGLGLSSGDAIKRIANELGVSVVTVDVNLPYVNVVYNLENKSSNAIRCARYKASNKIKVDTDVTVQLRNLQNNLNLAASAMKEEISIIQNSDSLKTIQEFSEQLRIVIPNAIREMDKWKATYSYYGPAINGFVSNLKNALVGLSELKPDIIALDKLSKIQFVYWESLPQNILEKVISIGNDDKVLDYLGTLIENDNIFSAELTVEAVISSDFMGDNVLLEQSVSAFERGDYNLASVGFTSLLDRILAENYMNKKELSLFKRADYLLHKIQESDAFTLDDEEYAELELMYSYYQSIQQFGERSEFDNDEPVSLNRHWLMHGRTDKFMNKIDCVRIIRMLYGTMMINELVEKESWE